MQALTAALIFSVSDVLSQRLGQQPPSIIRNILVAVRNRFRLQAGLACLHLLDALQINSMHAFMGLCWGGPRAHTWMKVS
jgi:hypothetical protein